MSRDGSELMRGAACPAAPGASGEVIERARRGDELAFELVWRAYQPQLLRFLFARGGVEVEDLAAETWLRVVRQFPRAPSSPEHFIAWLFTIARNLAIDAARARVRRPVTLAQDEDLRLLERAQLGDPVHQILLEELTTNDALALIRSLPPEQAEVVALRVIADLDVLTVAAVLGKSPGAVRVACHRGLRNLAARIGQPDRVLS